MGTFMGHGNDEKMLKELDMVKITHPSWPGRTGTIVHVYNPLPCGGGEAYEVELSERLGDETPLYTLRAQWVEKL